MTTEKIKKHRLQKTAFVYLRQSSPTQVKRNVEGSRRQRQMQDRMKELGWPAARIRMLGGDTGNSGSTLHGREDYQTIVEGNGRSSTTVPFGNNSTNNSSSNSSGD